MYGFPEPKPQNKTSAPGIKDRLSSTYDIRENKSTHTTNCFPFFVILLCFNLSAAEKFTIKSPSAKASSDFTGL